jgi:basic amino acid/polyamine antiporter, APA family
MHDAPKLKIWTAISVVIGCVIGSGVFVKPGRVLLAVGDSNMALLAWLLGGIISMAGGLSVAEIATRIPKSGGVYVYIEELFGKLWGFLCGWVQAIIYGPALMAALALYFGSLMAQFLNLPDTNMVKPIALISLFILSGVTALSTNWSAIIQNSTTFVKLIPIAILGIAGLAMGDSPIFNMQLANNTQGTGMGVAILATLWAYDGWIQVANIAEELENPVKNLPRSIIIGLAAIIVTYLVVNMSLFHVVPLEQIAVLNEKTAAVAAETLFGSWGGKVLSLGILIAIFGCLNGNILTMTRVPYAMALRGAFPSAQIFSILHPKFKTPVNSITLKTFIAAIMVLLLDPDRVTDIALFSIYIFYGAVFIGVILLRKKYGAPAPGNYRVPLYPIVPLIAGGGSFYICYAMFTQAPWDAAISLGVALTGIPVFYWMKRKEKLPT